MLLLALLALAGSGDESVRGQSPGLPQRSYRDNQVMEVIATIDRENGAPEHHSSVVMHQGYLVEVYSDGSNHPTGGIAFFDITNPARPSLVARKRNLVGVDEQHAIGFSNSYPGDYVALLAEGGVQFWDWSDIQNPRQLSYLKLPGVTTGYATGAWWIFWQAPYLYLSGASNGIFIIDASDPAQPFLVDRDGQPNPIPNSQTGGFRVGPIFAIGNLMVISSNEGAGYATLDISDPKNPTLRNAILHGTPASYSSMVNGNRIYAAGTDHRLHGFDISDPDDIEWLTSADMRGRGGYLTVQDGIAHVGASEHYAKIDVRDDYDFVRLDTASSGIRDRDEDFAVVLGNLVVVSDDHGNGSSIIPHQAEPDTAPPEVTMISPADGAVNQGRTSRVGLTFSDQIDLRTVNAQTVIVRLNEGEPLAGKYSGQTGIVNFAPDEPLEAAAVYEVILPAGGVKDLTGNSIAADFKATFSTGSSVGSSLICEVETAPRVLVDRAAELNVDLVKGGGGLRYTWEFGDDTPKSAELRSPGTAHIYSQPGHYTVRATVSNGTDSTACAGLQTIAHPVRAGQAPTSATILLERSGNQVWNVNPDQNSVSAVNAVTLKSMFEAPVGQHPRTLAQAPDGTIWVVNQDDATVSVLDTAGNVVATIALPHASMPYGIIFNPDGSSAYVTLQATGQLLALDPTARSITRRLDVGVRPRGLAFGAGRIYVSRFISPDSHGEVVEVDPISFTQTRVISLGFDLGPDSEGGGRGVPNALQAPVVSPDDRELWVPSKKDNIVRGLQLDGLPHTFETTVRTVVSRIDLVAGQEKLSERLDFNNRDIATAVRFSPLGDYAFVALQGSNAIDVVDAYTGQFVTAIENVGRAPSSLVFTGDGGKMFVHSWLTRSLLVYDVREILHPGDLKAKLVKEINLVEEERLPPNELEGKHIFYNAKDSRMNRDGYISCASCHLDGGQDGRTWDRADAGEGFRNTISLLGRGADGHGLAHWSANFDEMQDFEHDMRALFGGTGFLADAEFELGTRDQPLGDAKAGLNAELDALATYVNSLKTTPRSPFRNPDGTLTADGVAGRELFGRLQCAACHGDPQFTDSPTGYQHDVAALKPTSGQRLGRPLLGIDTPSLRGLWLTAPYLHDGSAATLADIFTTQDTTHAHGNAAALAELTADELDKLVSYLLQIDDQEIAPPLLPPAIEIVQPQAGARLRAGQPVDIRIDTTTTLGPVAKVEFFVDGEWIGEDTKPIYSFTWPDPLPGEHIVAARLVYVSGLKTTVPGIRVQVDP